MDKKTLIQILVIVISLIAMVTGIKQMIQGVKAVAGIKEPYQVLAKEADEKISEANALNSTNHQAFVELLNQFESLGPKAFREEKKSQSIDLQKNFTKVEEAFRIASQKLVAAIKAMPESKAIPILEGKVIVYELYADAAKWNGEIVELLLDETVLDTSGFSERAKPIIKRRDDAQERAETQQATTEALRQKLGFSTKA